MVLIRSLPKADMGIWALFLVVTSIFEATKSALLKNAHIKYVSGDTANPEKSVIASSSFLINLLINIIFIFLILAFSTWLNVLLKTGPVLSDMLHWFIPGMIGMVFFSHLEAIQQSHFDFKGVFAGHLVRQFVFFCIILIHLIFHISITLRYLAFYQSISILLGSATLYFYSRKHLLVRFNPSIYWIKKILRYGSYIFGSGIISNIFSNLDQLMTAHYMSTSSVAFYNAATRINGFIDIPSYAASEILFPKMSRASVEEGIGKVKYFYERMVSILMSLIAPIAFFIILFPSFVIRLIAGQQYLQAVPILQLYIIGSFLGPMQNQAANTLNSIGKQGLCFTMNLISLAAKLFITFICLVNFGFYGAAIGSLITSMLNGIFWYNMMKKQIGVRLSNIGRYSLNLYKSAYSYSRSFITRSGILPR